MDGDDAVEFFKDFAAEFQVNLDDLYARWDQHFGPEGGPSFGFLVILVACIITGFWLRDRFGWLPAWAWGIALILAVILAYQFWFAKKMLPITVGDLVESARSGLRGVGQRHSTDESFEQRRKARRRRVRREGC
jgi:hypothetical protein